MKAEKQTIAVRNNRCLVIPFNAQRQKLKGQRRRYADLIQADFLCIGLNVDLKDLQYFSEKELVNIIDTFDINITPKLKRDIREENTIKLHTMTEEEFDVLCWEILEKSNHDNLNEIDWIAGHMPLPPTLDIKNPKTLSKILKRDSSYVTIRLDVFLEAIKILYTESGKLKIKRSQRRDILFQINRIEHALGLKSIISTAKKSRNAWINLCRVLHPGEYKYEYPGAFEFFSILQDKDKLRDYKDKANSVYILNNNTEDMIDAFSSDSDEFSKQLFTLFKKAIKDGKEAELAGTLLSVKNINEDLLHKAFSKIIRSYGDGKLSYEAECVCSIIKNKIINKIWPRDKSCGYLYSRTGELVPIPVRKIDYKPQLTIFDTTQDDCKLDWGRTMVRGMKAIILLAKDMKLLAPGKRSYRVLDYKHKPPQVIFEDCEQFNTTRTLITAGLYFQKESTLVSTLHLDRYFSKKEIENICINNKKYWWI